MTEEKIKKLLSRCGYNNVDEVKDEASTQLAKVVLANITIAQPKLEHKPQGYFDVRSGPSKQFDNDINDYEYIQRSFDRY
jgi:hypothetical protein